MSEPHPLLDGVVGARHEVKQCRRDAPDQQRLQDPVDQRELLIAAESGLDISLASAMSMITARIWVANDPDASAPACLVRLGRVAFAAVVIRLALAWRDGQRSGLQLRPSPGTAHRLNARDERLMDERPPILCRVRDRFEQPSVWGHLADDPKNRHRARMLEEMVPRVWSASSTSAVATARSPITSPSAGR